VLLAGIQGIAQNAGKTDHPFSAAVMKTFFAAVIMFAEGFRIHQ
jgi:hypothetical protein